MNWGVQGGAQEVDPARDPRLDLRRDHALGWDAGEHGLPDAGDHGHVVEPLAARGHRGGHRARATVRRRRPR